MMPRVGPSASHQLGMSRHETLAAGHGARSHSHASWKGSIARQTSVGIRFGTPCLARAVGCKTLNGYDMRDMEEGHNSH
jgi:hypothetical protein